MALELISRLFAERDGAITTQDIQYGIEDFLQRQLNSENIHCKIVGSTLRMDIRVGSPALAQEALIREYDIRQHATTHFECSLGDMRVILEM